MHVYDYHCFHVITMCCAIVPAITLIDVVTRRVRSHYCSKFSTIPYYIIKNRLYLSLDVTVLITCQHFYLLADILKIDNLWTFTKLVKLQLDNNIIEKIEGLHTLTCLVWLGG